MHTRLLRDWSSLKRMRHLRGGSAYAALTVAVPIFTSIKIFMHEHFGFLFPTPVNEIVLYFSALSYYVGTALFDIFSPRAIATYKSRFEFVAEWSGHSEKMHELRDKSEQKIKTILDTRLAPLADSQADTAVSPDRLDDALQSIFEDISATSISTDAIQGLDQTWHDENHLRPTARFFVQAFFVISITLAAYVSLYDAPLKVVKSML